MKLFVLALFSIIFLIFASNCFATEQHGQERVKIKKIETVDEDNANDMQSRKAITVVSRGGGGGGGGGRGGDGGGGSRGVGGGGGGRGGGGCSSRGASKGGGGGWFFWGGGGHHQHKKSSAPNAQIGLTLLWFSLALGMCFFCF